MARVYRVDFAIPGGGSYRLDTPDAAKIGPWLADMFGLSPWDVVYGNPVSISHRDVRFG
jgi:hypothetical protein